MCSWCGRSPIADRLTSRFGRSAPSRRDFLAYAASLGAAVAAFDARDVANASGGADVIFRNGTVIPMSAQGRAEALAIGGGKILAVGTVEQR